MIRDFLRSILSRLLAAPLAALVGFFGESAAGLDEAILTVLVLFAYAVLHKLFDALGINPEDTAKNPA